MEQTQTQSQEQDKQVALEYERFVKALNNLIESDNGFIVLRMFLRTSGLFNHIQSFERDKLIYDQSRRDYFLMVVWDYLTDENKKRLING